MKQFFCFILISVDDSQNKISSTQWLHSKEWNQSTISPMIFKNEKLSV